MTYYAPTDHHSKWGVEAKQKTSHICIKSFGAYLPSLKLSQRCLGYQWRHDDIGSIQVTTLTILSDRNVEYEICFPWGTDAIFHWDWKHALSSNRGAPRLSYSDSESFWCFDTIWPTYHPMHLSHNYELQNVRFGQNKAGSVAHAHKNYTTGYRRIAHTQIGGH